MPSFLIRGLARYFAASAMESRERRQSSYTPPSGTSSDGEKKLSAADLASWQSQMRWLIPFVQATGNQIVIENPKSHEQIVIDKNTTQLPELTLEWMQKYDKQELLEWIANEKEREQQEEKERQKKIEARRIEEVRGRARFGNSFTLVDKNDGKKKSKSANIEHYLIPIICICVFILALIGLWVYNSPAFEYERWKKEQLKHSFVVRQEEDDDYLKNKALVIIKNDLSHSLDNYHSYQPIETKMYSVNLEYLGDTLIQDLTKAIKEADSVVLIRDKEDRKAMKAYRSFGDSDGRYKIEAGSRWGSATSALFRARGERRIIVDSLSSLVKERGQNSNILGWRVNHVFHQNGRENYFDDNYTYYLDKDCGHILLKLCGNGNQTLHVEDGYYYWSDDYIEIANRLYETTNKQGTEE